MSTSTNVNVAGRQKTLTDCWTNVRNDNRPILSQRQKKRLKKSSSPMFVDGQSALSADTAGAWNLRQGLRENRMNQEKEYWGDQI